ncbi:MAG: diaminopimelate epimerase [Candidatus Delongbacteria bacterium]|nr:diaminopimelate epimerase [Candidatus Delongbacteria bacterium]
MKFYKMHGAGNDFIFFEGDPEISSSGLKKICDRNLGIGADGVIFIKKVPDSDFKMKYFNADGSKADFCANGGRCAVLLASVLMYFKSTHCTFVADDGVHEGSILESGDIMIKMAAEKDYEEGLLFEGIDNNFYYINTGVEHVVGFYDNIDAVDVHKFGSQIRNNRKFPNGTNANFVQRSSNNTLLIRTYERGVEAETKACGTGITAAGLIDMRLSGDDKKIIRTVLGYEMTVQKKDGSVFLCGPAELVFEGFIDLSAV